VRAQRLIRVDESMDKRRKENSPAESRPVTLADIGREAGVSFSIVSRVLRNRRDRIPDETRKRVMDAAERLGYRRNLLIRGVQTGRSMNIGVVVPPVGSYYSKIVRGIHDELHRNEYCLLLAWNPHGEEDPLDNPELRLIHSLVDRRVDGIILLPTQSNVSDLYFSEIMERNIPLVTVDRPLSGVHCDFSGSADELGARLAARHLLERGCRNLVHLAVKSKFAPGQLREYGFTDECRTMPRVKARTAYLGEYHTDLAEVAATRVLASDDRPDGVCLSSDNLAIGFYRAAKKLGLRIPQDVSVVGFGNDDRNDELEPPLTSVDQNPFQIGRNAVRMLMDRIGGNGGKATSLLAEPSLVARGSVVAGDGRQKS
jgi:LacI family transcriptional regulator